MTGNIFGREMKESVMVKMNKKELERALKTSGKGVKSFWKWREILQCTDQRD